jgi:hypothetical protein
MVTFTNSGLKDVYISGPTKTYIAAGRIAYGAAVIRAGAGTIKAAILPESMLVIGIADSDEQEHLYDGFYESGEPVRVVLPGGRCYALVTTEGNTDLIAGDYLSVLDGVSGTMTSECGILGEGGTTTGENRVVGNCARLLEDVALTSAVYATISAPTAGATTITMSTGVPTTLTLQVGDYIFLSDADGTTGQVNRVSAITDTLLTVEIPVLSAAITLIHAVKQAEVMVI